MHFDFPFCMNILSRTLDIMTMLSVFSGAANKRKLYRAQSVYDAINKSGSSTIRIVTSNEITHTCLSSHNTHTIRKYTHK